MLERRSSVARPRRVIEHPRCSRVRRTVSAALDGEASTVEVLSVALHLSGCASCRQFAVHVTALTRALALRLGSIDLADPGG